MGGHSVRGCGEPCGHHFGRTGSSFPGLQNLSGLGLDDFFGSDKASASGFLTARTLESALTNLLSSLLNDSLFAENSVWRLPVAGFLDCVSADPLLPQQRQFVSIYQKLLFSGPYSYVLRVTRSKQPA